MHAPLDAEEILCLPSLPLSRCRPSALYLSNAALLSHANRNPLTPSVHFFQCVHTLVIPTLPSLPADLSGAFVSSGYRPSETRWHYRIAPDFGRASVKHEHSVDFCNDLRRHARQIIPLSRYCGAHILYHAHSDTSWPSPRCSSMQILKFVPRTVQISTPHACSTVPSLS